MCPPSDDDSRDDDYYESRADRKRQADTLQLMGERLVELTDGQLRALNLPDRLHLAVVEARSIRAFGGRKRQMQFIGKLMRSDALDLNAITDLFAQLDGKKPEGEIKQDPLIELTEQWRTRIIADASAIFVLREEFPDIDTQRLRQWARNANSVSNVKQANRAKKAMFKYLKSTLLGEGPSDD